jgi:hypothetical protein
MHHEGFAARARRLSPSLSESGHIRADAASETPGNLPPDPCSPARRVVVSSFLRGRSRASGDAGPASRARLVSLGDPTAPGHLNQVSDSRVELDASNSFKPYLGQRGHIGRLPPSHQGGAGRGRFVYIPRRFETFGPRGNETLWPANLSGNPSPILGSFSGEFHNFEVLDPTIAVGSVWPGLGRIRIGTRVANCVLGARIDPVAAGGLRGQQRRSAMRSLLGWITDARVHLVVTGILLLHFAINFGASSEPASEKSSHCQKCHFAHGYGGPCSPLALNHGPHPVAR